MPCFFAFSLTRFCITFVWPSANLFLVVHEVPLLSSSYLVLHLCGYSFAYFILICSHLAVFLVLYGQSFSPSSLAFCSLQLVLLVDSLFTLLTISFFNFLFYLVHVVLLCFVFLLLLLAVLSHISFTTPFPFIWFHSWGVCSVYLLLFLLFFYCFFGGRLDREYSTPGSIHNQLWRVIPYYMMTGILLPSLSLLCSYRVR